MTEIVWWPCPLHPDQNSREVDGSRYCQRCFDESTEAAGEYGRAEARALWDVHVDWHVQFWTRRLGPDRPVEVQTTLEPRDWCPYCHAQRALDAGR